MLVDLVGGSYKAKYMSLNPRRTINWYIHKETVEAQGDKYPKSLYPFPGLTTFCTLTGTVNGGMFNAKTLVDDRLFAVCDNILYEIDSTGTATSRGTMSSMTAGGTVFMECNSNRQLMIANSSAGYILDMSSNVLTQITDGDYPTAITCLTEMDGYFIVCTGGRVYYSNLLDGTAWTATDVFTPSSRSDPTIAAIAWRDELHCFGTETIEVYINDGDSPFSKLQRTTTPIGILSVDTLKQFKDGFFFIGKTRYGQLGVYYYNGQDCTDISEPINWSINNPSLAIELTWDQLSTYNWEDWNTFWGSALENSYSELQFSKDGHTFYYLTIPFLGTTWIYDLNSKEWTERQSTAPIVLNQSCFRGKYFVNFKGLQLWQDIYSTKVFKDDYTVATEDSLGITRTVTTQIFHEENKFISVYSLDFQVNAGTGTIASSSTAPNILVYTSKDGGNTFSTAKTVSLGASPNYNTRPRITKLGTARNWVIKIVLTDAADVTMQQAIAHGTVGAW